MHSGEQRRVGAVAPGVGLVCLAGLLAGCSSKRPLASPADAAVSAPDAGGSAGTIPQVGRAPARVDGSVSGATDAAALSRSDALKSVPAAGDAGQPDAPSECHPQVETCNGADDDCDGPVDEGCPSGPLTLVGVYRSGVFGSAADKMWDGACPDGALLSGFDLYGTTSVRGLRPLCTTFSVEEDRGVTPFAFRLIASEAKVQPGFGDLSGEQTTIKCSGGSAIVSLEGRSGSQIDSLFFHCAVPQLVRNGPGYDVSLSGSEHSAVFNLGSTGGAPFAAACPSPSAASGVFGWYQPSFIWSIGVACVEARVVVRP